MGKVQDTLYKLTGRGQPHSRAMHDLLTVPNQQPPSPASFPTAPAQVLHWLDEQQPFDHKTSIGALIRALQHSNRLLNDNHRRLQIMALFEAPVATATATLRSQYDGHSLPLPESSVQAFGATISLLEEMAYGYKIALRQAPRNHQLPPHKRLQASVAAMRHLATTCLTHALCYRDWPARIWHDLHTLYYIANVAGYDRELIDESAPQSVASIYLQICILAISDSHRLNARQIQALFNYLAIQTSSIELQHPHSIETSLPTETDWITMLDSDEPPLQTRFAHPQHQHYRRFDLATVANRLDDLMIDHSDQRGRVNTFSRNTLNRLHQVWQGTTRRQIPRATRTQPLTIEIGLHNLHASMAHFSPIQEPLAADPQQLDINHFAQQNTEATVQPTNKARQVGNLGTHWHLENVSKRGIGLMFTGDGRCQIRVGELVGHCFVPNSEDRAYKPDTLQWHLGVCRWLSNRVPGTLRCGVESISTSARAVTAERLDNPCNEPGAEAILLNHNGAANGPAMLLLPCKVYQSGDIVCLVSEHQRRPVLLAERINLTGSFDCFGVQKAQQKVRSSQTNDYQKKPLADKKHPIADAI